MAVLPADPSASTSASNVHNLSFPPLTYAKLRPQAFLAAHLTTPPSSRPSGRLAQEARPVSVHTGSLTHAHGSALVRIGNTTVVCGIRAETLSTRSIGSWKKERGLTPREDEEDGGSKAEKTYKHGVDANEIAEFGLLVPNLELSTGCNPAYLPGSPPTSLAQSLTQRIITLLKITDLVQLDDLKIWHDPVPLVRADKTGSAKGMAGGDMEVENDDEEGQTKSDEDNRPQIKAFWTLYIDVWFLSLDGNPFDAAWLAVLAALRATRLPKSWWDAERDCVVSNDRRSEATRLTIRGCPVPLTAAVFEDGSGPAWLLADPDDFEEGQCAETVTVVVDNEGRNSSGKVQRLWRVEKNGGSYIGVKEVKTCVELAGQRWKEIRAVLDEIR